MFMQQTELFYEIPLSPYSKIFYDEWRLSPNGCDYNIVFDQELIGEINTSRMNNAIKRLISENVLLNSHIEDRNDGLFWINNHHIYDLEYLENTLKNDKISFFTNDAFNLEVGPLYRFLLIKNENKKYRLIVTLHHIVIGGSSFDFFIDELSKYYNDKYYKNNISINAQIEEIRNLSQKLSSQLEISKTKSKSFWNEKLENIEPLDLNFLYKRNKSNVNNNTLVDVSSESQNLIKKTSKLKEVRFNFSKKTVKDLNLLHKKFGISPYLYSQSVYAIVIHKYTAQDKFSISYPIAIKEGQHFIFGAQVNTNVMIYDFKKFSNIIDLIDCSKNFIKSLKYENVNHAYLPISDILSVSNKSILNCSFIQTNLKDKKFEFHKIKSKINSNTSVDLLDDFLFEQEVRNEEIHFRVRYRSDKIDLFLINNLIESYKKLFTVILTDWLKNENKDDIISFDKYSLLSEKKYEKIVESWNKTDRKYLDNKTIQRLFEEQVEKTPETIAIIYEGTKLTYRELNERSNQLAHYILQNRTINPDTLIALCLDRSEHMMIGILAVLKAGAAYVPMDPSYPESRIKYILEDTSTSLVLTNESHKQRLEKIVRTRIPQFISRNEQLEKNKEAVEILAIDEGEVQDSLSGQPFFNPETETTSRHLAYVIYTSGTTGNPKGVMIEHRGVVSLKKDLTSRYKLGGKDNKEVILQFSNYVFDVSIEQIILSILNGYSLLLIPNHLWVDENKFYEVLNINKVTHIDATPTFLAQCDLSKISNLKRVIFGGERLSAEVFDKILLSKDIKLINSYGPTETTITSIVNLIENGNLAIGRPISNTRCYVLDRNLNPLPTGAIGELYIGGVGLARGYLNQPELTAERFIKNPFQTEKEKAQEKSARLYKTGDLVRWREDGNLEYIGRTDFQVKIQGYRIELGEIESALSSYDGIKQSVVLAKNHRDSEGQATKNKYLVGYYVSEGPLDVHKIQVYLQTKMPDYMVPSALVHLEKLPLTINGKLDRKALPDPTFTNQKTYVAPRNELERRVVELWAEVLGLSKETLGIQDDFFRVGGNSIHAIKLISKINKELNKYLPVASLFKHTTVERLSSFLGESSEEVIVINRSEVSKPEDQRLSFAQERLWFIEKYEQGTSAYNIQMIFKILDVANINALELSLKSIFARHEILRTLIKEDDEGNAYQSIMDDQAYPLEIQKIKVRDQDQLGEKLRKEINHIYDLSQEYPIRICLYKCDAEKGTHQEDYLSIIIHHIAFDGWSGEIFLEELEVYYNYHLKALKGKETPLVLPQLSIQYKDFAFWQRRYLSEERLIRDLNYWKGKLDGHETLILTTDKPRPSQIDYSGADIPFEIDEETSESLRSLAKELNVSLYSLLLSGYYLMLMSYSNQDDIVIGTPIANRHYGQIENLIGFFVNTLALRIKIDSKQTLKDYIQGLGREIQEAQLYQDFPFEKLVEELKVDKDTSRHPIFQTMFGLESFEGNKSRKREQESKLLKDFLENYKGKGSGYTVAKFDLSTFIDDRGLKLIGIFNYAESLYREETIRGYMETYIHILRQLSRLSHNPIQQEKTKIYELNYLSKTQYEKIVENWNKTNRGYPDDKTIQRLFEEQVEKTPETIAIIYEGTKLTYKELNERSNQLAHYILQNQVIKPDTLITLCLDRSEHMLIGILAVLKTGAAYVPMDPSYPDSRIEYMLKDTSTSLVLTNESHKQRLEGIIRARVPLLIPCDEQFEKYKEVVKVLAIDKEEIQDFLPEQPLCNPETETTSHHLAYVIYTSGTTGNPKGVMVEHKCVVNLLCFLNNVYDFRKGNKITAFTSYVFDVSVSEFFAALVRGGELHLLSERNKSNVHLISNYILKNNINYIYLPPVLLSIFPRIKYDSLHGIVYAGEPCDIDTGKYWSINYKLYNYYGPTEATIYASGKKIINGDTHLIGSPISNIKCYALNSNLEPLPIGAIGELYIGGAGLARGYLNRAELTAEKFIANPLQSKEERIQNKNVRLYKTGDLVRWLSDGNLEYIGRNDFQVKIRGHRIELGEIETALSSYEGIKQCSVLAITKKYAEGESQFQNKYLVGYYVSETSVDEKIILTYLSSRLPEYMVPNILISLEELPLTPNGKLDKIALPNPEFTRRGNYVAPRNELESQVCQILAEVLSIEKHKVGIEDDFFRLGGDSITTIQFVNKLRQRLGVTVSVKDIFKYRSIERIYDNILSKNMNMDIYSDIKTEQNILSGAVGLLPIQEYFFGNNFQKVNHYNQSFIIRIPKLDLDKLQKNLKKLIEYHDSFRLRYEKANDSINTQGADFEDRETNYKQYYDPKAKPVDLKTLDIRTLGVEEDTEEFEAKLDKILTIWQSDFDLKNGPTYCIGYLYGYRNGSARLYFAFHHLIVDAVSWRIIIEDLRNLYEGKKLGFKGSSYRQWVNTIATYKKHRIDEKDYWINVLKDYDCHADPLINLINYDDHNISEFYLDHELTNKILRESNRTYNTEVNDLLLTAFSYTLSQITNYKVNCITLEGHGREEIDSTIDIARTLGWFTTMYPVRLEVRDNLGETIKHIKEMLRQIPNKGIGFGALMGYKTRVLPRISFNYLGQFDSKEGIYGGLQGFWNITTEKSGMAIHPTNYDHNIIHINGMVANGCLQFIIESKLEINKTVQIKDFFKKKLEEIIEHTIHQPRSYLTLSDLNNGALT